MRRMTNDDKKWGPFTLARWIKTIAAYVQGADDEDPETFVRVIAFGWAIQILLPQLIKPFGKYSEHSREYGFSLSDMGNGYDFLQVFFGPQTHDSSTTKNWCKHLPWKQWRCVRWSVYTPDGTHFASEEKGKGKFLEFCETKRTCPSSKFDFQDYDGEKIIATCIIEEREWHRGEGWFKWLKYFYQTKVARSLDLQFSAEVGTEKGSWKGGTIGHGIDMLNSESPQQAFERYCAKEHECKGRKFSPHFVGVHAE